MTTSLPDLDWSLAQIALAERLGHKSRERILSRMLLGTPLLASVKIEADYMAESWANYDDKVQIRAIQIAFDELRHPL